MHGDQRVGQHDHGRHAGSVGRKPFAVPARPQRRAQENVQERSLQKEWYEALRRYQGRSLLPWYICRALSRCGRGGTPGHPALGQRAGKHVRDPPPRPAGKPSRGGEPPRSGRPKGPKGTVGVGPIRGLMKSNHRRIKDEHNLERSEHQLADSRLARLSVGDARRSSKLPPFWFGC